uniref:Ig-like domain-containing protein n=1 Tax=Periophthalmus magnuspinnatus TaxID=409849 RepID=A0A3B4APQ8_9GOBI
MHLYKPKNTNTEIVGQTREVEEGRSVTFKCNSDANPHPVSTLTLNRTSQGSSVELLRDTEHNSLTYSVTVSSAHSGEYTCSAHNTVGSDSTKRSLTVKCGSTEEEQSPDGSSSVTLSCSSHSFPPVNLYTWYRRTEDRALKVSEHINYTVLSTQPGVYYCTAKNQISESTSETVSLFLQRKRRP